MEEGGKASEFNAKTQGTQGRKGFKMNAKTVLLTLSNYTLRRITGELIVLGKKRRADGSEGSVLIVCSSFAPLPLCALALDSCAFAPLRLCVRFFAPLQPHESEIVKFKRL